jgi:heme b synthase
MMKDDLTTQEAYQLIDQILEVGKPILILSGGEPLIRPDIFEIARYGVGKGLTVSLATNGTLVDAAIAQKLKEAGVARVSVSLDGGDSETHDIFRRLPGSFGDALRGIEYLKAAGVPFQLNSTIAKHNAHQLADMFRLAKDLGAVAFHVFMLVPVGCGVEIAEDQMLTPGGYEEILNEFYDLSQQGGIETKATCAPHYYRILRQRAKAEGKKVTFETHGMAAVTRGCLAGTAVCFVSHKGEVFPCGYLPVEAGNIRRERFKDIWENSTTFATLRDLDSLEGKCGFCEYRKACEGCRARAYYETGSIMGEEPYCVYEPKARALKAKQEAAAAASLE